MLELEEFLKACKTIRRSIRNRLTLLEEKKLLEEQRASLKISKGTAS